MAAIVPVDTTGILPYLLKISNNTVLNCTTNTGGLRLHHEKRNDFTFIGRMGSSNHVKGNFDWLYHGGIVFYLKEEVTMSDPLEVLTVFSTREEDGDRLSTLTLQIVGPNGSRSYVATPRAGETEPAIKAAEAQVDPAPGVLVKTESLAGVIFTSSLESSLSGLSLGDTDSIAEQQATLDTYKQALDRLTYRHEITTVNLGAFSSSSIQLGPLTITIAFDPSKGEGSVTASIIGISLGTAKFNLTKGAELSLDVWLAKASVKVFVRDRAIYLEAHASVRWGPSVDYGPSAIIHF